MPQHERWTIETFVWANGVFHIIETLEDIKIGAMIFDRADNLVAAGTWVVRDAHVVGQGLLLAPGEISTFDAWFGALVEGGSPEHIVIGSHGVEVESE